ncbi:MAG: hypothetical protein CBE00_13660 [Planctomycetaceae bacterium TMED240]|nr:hypothetical protein [Rhodopirellula sp.]OUX03791.1 MAG: hypothetical protein CBE00_13660 [Planctomycetaceae bacterium TMED240]
MPNLSAILNNFPPKLISIAKPERQTAKSPPAIPRCGNVPAVQTERKTVSCNGSRCTNSPTDLSHASKFRIDYTAKPRGEDT